MIEYYHEMQVMKFMDSNSLAEHEIHFSAGSATISAFANSIETGKMNKFYGTPITRALKQMKSGILHASH